MMRLLKRIFCKHNYMICTFTDYFTGLEFPCRSCNGDTLVECTKCGKHKVTRWLRNPTGRNPNPYCDEEDCCPDGSEDCIGCSHNKWDSKCKIK